jgi:hypothetical protein
MTTEKEEEKEEKEEEKVGFVCRLRVNGTRHFIYRHPTDRLPTLTDPWFC